MEHERVNSPTDDATGSAAGVAIDHSGIGDRPSTLVVLAFIALVSALALLGTSGVAAAASTFLGGPPVDCGGP
jgi:hypothetical protein